MDIFSTYSIECGKLRSSGRALCGLAAETLRLRIGPRSYLPAGLRRAGCSRNIQEGCRAILSVALRIAYPFHYARTFQSFYGALRARECNRQFVRHAFCGNERISPQEFDNL